MGRYYQRYLDMFLAVVHVMKTDYVGRDAGAPAVEASRFADEITTDVMHGTDTDDAFVRVVRAYLACFRDPLLSLDVVGEGSFYHRRDYGIDVRRRGGALVVARSGQPDVAVGDEIVGIDDVAVPVIARRRARSLFGEADERQDWSQVLAESGGRLELRCADGARRHTRLANLLAGDAGDGASRGAGDAATRDASRGTARPDAIACENTCGAVSLDARTGVGTLTLRDLGDVGATRGLLAAGADTLGRATALIVDARDCTGDDELAAREVLPYVVDDGASVATLVETAGVTRFAEGNCDAVIAALAKLPADQAADLRELRDEFTENRGRGNVTAPLPGAEAFAAPVSARGPRAVAVLSDVTCAGAGEMVVEAARAASRTTVVGRRTRGARGALLPVSVMLDDHFCLRYPICRFTDEGLRRHFAQEGVPVDVPVPWSPRVPGRDEDLSVALATLGR